MNYERQLTEFSEFWVWVITTEPSVGAGSARKTKKAGVSGATPDCSYGENRQLYLALFQIARLQCCHVLIYISNEWDKFGRISGFIEKLRHKSK